MAANSREEPRAEAYHWKQPTEQQTEPDGGPMSPHLSIDTESTA